MVLTDLLERLLEFGSSSLFGFGFEASLLATALILLYHGHSILSFIQTAINSMRIAFFGAAAVALLLILSVSMGWISVGSLPSLPLPLVVVGL
jgi:hypothetical protein